MPIGLAVEQIENPFGAGHGGQRGVVLIAQHGDRREKQIGHQKESDQIADVRGRTGVQHLIATDQQQQRHEQLIVQIQQRQEQTLRAVDDRVVLRVIAHQVAEQFGVNILPHEALRDANAVDTFGQRGGHAAERIAHSPQARC